SKVQRLILAFGSFAHYAGDFALRVALGQALALVVELLAPGDGHFHLCAAPHEVHLEGHQGQALLLDLAPQALYLLAVEEELARAGRLVVEVGARLRPGRHVRVEQPGLAVFDADVALAEVGPPGPHTLYLRA